MPIAINGSGTITGVSVGGLPDGIVDADMLASSAVTTAKINDDAVTDAKQSLSGAAKAWINYNGSTNAIRDSFNVSSITDEGGGTHQINFTTAFANANYAAAGLCSFGIYARTTTPGTTSTFKVGTFDTRNAANQDEHSVYLAFFGD